MNTTVTRRIVDFGPPDPAAIPTNSPKWRTAVSAEKRAHAGSLF